MTGVAARRAGTHRASERGKSQHHAERDERQQTCGDNQSILAVDAVAFESERQPWNPWRQSLRQSSQQQQCGIADDRAEHDGRKQHGSAVSFLVEHAGDRKGYSASWQWTSTGIISVIVSLFGLTLTTLLTHQQLIDWGWRIPYVFGLLVGPVGLYIRARMAETPEFLEAAKPPTVPIGELLHRHPISVLLAFGISIISNSSYYLLLYIPTYGVKTLHLPAYTGFAATLLGGVVLAIFSVIAGHWSDKTARPRIMLAMAWLFAIAAYPTFWLMVAFPSLATAMFAVGLLNLIKAGYSGVLPSLLAEQFPVETRAVGIAFSYSVSVTIFGGFAPFVATWLIAQTGDPLSTSFYLMATALLSVIALVAIQRRVASRPGSGTARCAAELRWSVAQTMASVSRSSARAGSAVITASCRVTVSGCHTELLVLTIQLRIAAEYPGLLERYAPFARQIDLQARPIRHRLVQDRHARQLRQLSLGRERKREPQSLDQLEQRQIGIGDGAANQVIRARRVRCLESARTSRGTLASDPCGKPRHARSPHPFVRGTTYPRRSDGANYTPPATMSVIVSWI